MKKYACVIFVLLIVFSGCKELKRTNPMDPEADNYIGISYKGSVSYPAAASIKAMDAALGELVFGASYPGYGDCVIRGLSGLPQGTFTQITDVCADDFGNIYAVDHTANITVVSPAGTVSQFGLNIINGIDTLSVEWFNNEVYVSGSFDRTIISYTASGVQSHSTAITVTASGYFTPGRIFASDNYIYAADRSDPKRVVRFSPSLTGATEFKLSAAAVDGCSYKGGLLVLNGQSVMQCDEDLKVIKTWGNMGEGPGLILNGRAICYNQADGFVYVLDGATLKKFGE